MPKDEAHPNNVHACSKPSVEFASHIKSLTEIFSAEDCLSIIEFFVLHAPILTTSTTENNFGQRSLRYYGWTGYRDMTKLERLLLGAAQLPCFTILRSDSIEETLKSMQLKDSGCIIHPRAVLMQKHSFKAYENGEIQVTNGETRMECLFRHVRNALAHNRTFSLSDTMIMLQDEDEGGKITARLLIPSDALIKWRKTILKEDNNST